MQPDMNQMMMQAQKMQKAMMKMQDDLANANLEGTAGGGAVTIVCSGTLEFKAVKIKPEAVDPSDVETLEDLVLTALHDAKKKCDEEAQRLSKSLGLPTGLSF